MASIILIKMRWLPIFLVVVCLAALTSVVLFGLQAFSTGLALIFFLTILAIFTIIAAFFGNPVRDMLFFFFFAANLLDFIYLFLTQGAEAFVLILGIASVLGVLSVLLAPQRVARPEKRESAAHEKPAEKKEEIAKELAEEEEEPVEESSIIIEEIPEIKKVVASTSSKMYHEPECPVARKLTKKKKIVFEDSKAAKEKGY